MHEQVVRSIPSAPRRTADTIAGRVVDLSQTPVAGVLVQAWPRGPGFGASATSDARGGFEIALVQVRPHELEVVAQPPFADWHSAFGRPAAIAVGTHDVEIRLSRRVPTTFAVLDGATGDPVEVFGLAIEARPPRIDGVVLELSPRSAPRVEAHDAGTLVVAADPLGDDVTVVAPGFAPFEGAVALDAGAELRQTIRLTRGGTLRGVLVLDSASPPPTRVLVCRGFATGDRADAPIDTSLLGSDERCDLSSLTSHSREVHSSRDGTFAFEHLAAGTYQVQIEVERSVFLRLHPVRVADAKVTDLGTIALARGAAIHGRVVVDGRPWNGGLMVGIEGRQRWPEPIGAEGAFELETLAPGEHMLVLFGALVEHRARVTLLEGETRELEVDLTAVAPSSVRISVRRNGKPIAGARVSCTPDDVPTRTLNSMRGTTTDADGLVRMLVAPGRELEFVAHSHAGFELARSARRLRLEGGSEHVEDLDVVAGALVVELPDTLVPPRDGRLEIDCVPRDHPERRVTVVALAKDAAGFGPETVPWTAGPIDLSLVPPGAYELRSRAWNGEGESARARLFESAPVAVTIRANETTRVRLAPR